MIAARPVCALPVLFALCAPVLAGDRIDMTVTRNDEPIGSHTITFAREADKLHVDTKVEIAVKLAFVTVYRMLKTSRETWKGDRVVAYHADIDDNKALSKVTVRRDGESFAIDGPSGRVTAPLGTMISGYWTERTVKQKLLIDSSDGVLRRVSVGPAVAETLSVGGREIKARRYRMTGDLERDLWYGADGRLIQMREVASDGSVIVTALSRPARTN